MEVSVELVRVLVNETQAFVAVQLAGYALAVWFTGAWD